MTTVRELLFSDSAGQVTAAEKLGHDVSISQAVIGKVAESLSFEVGEVLVSAWRTKSALLTAARETRAHPGSARRVRLRSFAVPWDYEMDLEVMVNGARVTTITFELTLELEVAELAVVIQDGMLKRIDSGRYRISALLSAGHVPLVRRECELELRHEIKVGDGIPLISG